MSHAKPLLIALSALLSTTVCAETFLRDPAEVKTLLSGKRLQGVYLRTQSTYSLGFHPDGGLVDQDGERGRWWVNEQGQYCRKWESGRLTGHEACLDLVREGDKLAIYSSGKRVAEGSLAAE